jgi:cytochrome c peroxidase
MGEQVATAKTNLTFNDYDNHVQSVTQHALLVASLQQRICRLRMLNTALGRSLVYGSAALAATVAIVGFANIGFGAAVVGETRLSPQAARPDASTDAMKAEYRRPTDIPFPKQNPYTIEKAMLGKKLYFDTRLSVTSAQSCASCHNPGFGWGDGLAVGVGHGMNKLGRHSPTIINAAWGGIFMWDGRLPDLEHQALGPIASPGEMNMPIEKLMERLNQIPEYKPLFATAFPRDGMSVNTLAQAIATYERTVVSARAPFDLWVDGDEKAIPEEAKRGFKLFNTKAQCSGCHEGWNFTNDGFQDIGLASDDIGRGEYLPGVIKMKHAFKTPGLREIGRRSPYMHDGSLASLEQVIDHYDSGGVDRPSRSDLVKPLKLTAQEKTDLVAFLKTLTSNPDQTTVPVIPR